MPHSSFHAVSVKVGADAAAAGVLSSALASTTKTLHQQINQAQMNLAGFRVTALSHSHTLMDTADGMSRAVVTAIACYEYE